MNNQTGYELSVSRKLLLGATAAAAILGPVVIGVLAAPRLQAQTPTVPSAVVLTFETASIKASNQGDAMVRMQIQPGGRMNLSNVPLFMMIRTAYQLQDFQIVGGPDWLAKDRFDIVAKAEGNPTSDQMGQMLRALLGERFKLVAHQETRSLPIFALVKARSDGRLGPQMLKSSSDCAAQRNAPMARQPAPGPGTVFNCGFRVGPGVMTARGTSMAAFAGSLSGSVHRVVVDQTGLDGEYDVDLKYTPDQMPPTPPPGVGPFPPIDPNGPSIYTALQEQLGLKLDSRDGSVPVLVIDHVELPTSD